MLRQLCTLGQWQQQLLPCDIPQPEGWRLVVHHTGGLWPGGDYYDFLQTPDGSLFLLVGEASDQGAPAAALVALARALVHSWLPDSGAPRSPSWRCPAPGMPCPRDLLEHLDRGLVQNILEGHFMTAFCGALGPRDGSFHYANAGHPYPRLWRACSRTVESVRDAAGPPLGVNGSASYCELSRGFEPGDVLVLYTDGLTAALNARGRMFGCGRLDATVAESARRGAEAVKSAVLASLQDFLGGRAFDDEVTLLVLERRGGANDSNPAGSLGTR
jgi:sigma-B regulation protein RsbU (phosphoserine phosphatase)